MANSSHQCSFSAKLHQNSLFRQAALGTNISPFLWLSLNTHEGKSSATNSDPRKTAKSAKSSATYSIEKDANK
jgi:hypothetical protein